MSRLYLVVNGFPHMWHWNVTSISFNLLLEKDDKKASADMAETAA